MSNNGDAEYAGDSFYFTRETSRVVHEIQRDPKVSLAFSTAPGLLAGAGLYVSVEGKAQVVRDKAQFEDHWSPDLDIWFEQGVDTPGVVMLEGSCRQDQILGGRGPRRDLGLGARISRPLQARSNCLPNKRHKGASNRRGARLPIWPQTAVLRVWHFSNFLGRVLVSTRRRRCAIHAPHAIRANFERELP